MTEPALARSIAGKGRLYEHPITGEMYPSVTACISTIEKPALQGWAARTTAQAAWKNRRALVDMDEDEAVDLLKNSRFRSGDRAKNLGSHIHEIAECLAKDVELPVIEPEAAPFADRFIQFVDDYSVTFEAVEATVFSDTHRYAGTMDALIRIGDSLVIADWKTGGSGIYPEVALQLAALRYADLIWDEATGELHPMPEVAGCIAVWLRPERYVAYSIGADEAAFEAFLGSRGLWSWAKAGGSNGGVGPAMSPQRLGALLAGPTLVRVPDDDPRVPEWTDD